MTDNELLLAISDIVSTNSKMLEKRIDRVEDSLNKRIDQVETTLGTRIDEVEASLSTRIDKVETSVHNIRLRMENIIEPHLDEIQECYTSTYKRYQDGVDKIEMLEMNMDIVQSVVKEHAKKLNAMTA